MGPQGVINERERAKFLKGSQTNGYNEDNYQQTGGNQVVPKAGG